MLGCNIVFGEDMINHPKTKILSIKTKKPSNFITVCRKHTILKIYSYFEIDFFALIFSIFYMHRSKQ